ncbi:MAG TPA: SDR family NAD(P)-dependent oxidoreductase, partial [Bacteroidetes bacterium]|nr:SDR family NAD(P)-dependent oxidoreductase [Bacteroidota bacterium]
MDLKDKKIFLTGGSSGIGKVTAKILREAGAKVLITGRSMDKLESVAKDLDVLYLQMDMSDFGQIAGKTAEGIALLGGVDVLINNAGIGQFGVLGTLEVAHFQEVFATNVFGLAMMTQ